jgi:cyclin H
MVLTLEPEIMLKLDYHLTIHSPLRPFEGHLIDIKTRMANEFTSLGLDIESIRPSSAKFLNVNLAWLILLFHYKFQLCLNGDAMLLYPPSQIALAAVKHGLDQILGGKN